MRNDRLQRRDPCGAHVCHGPAGIDRPVVPVQGGGVPLALTKPAGHCGTYGHAVQVSRNGEPARAAGGVRRNERDGDGEAGNGKKQVDAGQHWSLPVVGLASTVTQRSARARVSGARNQARG
jgi:hypothetical protein